MRDMPEFMVTVDLYTDKPLTVGDLEAAAEIGGAASGNEGGRHLSATMTQETPEAWIAAVEGMKCLRRKVAGTAIGFHVQLAEEFDKTVSAA